MTDAACELDTSATVKTVPVCAKRTVCYEFDTKATDAGVAIPYLVIINGKIDGKLNKLDRSRKIMRTVNVGSTVALYLNSDVHPDHRSTPVYVVEVRDNNVLIRITEKTGQHADLRPVIGTPSTRGPDKPGEPAQDCYQAPLTGNIWMTVSHRYTEVEAEKLLASDTAVEIRQAIGSIYRGLQSARLQIPLTVKTADCVKTLNVAFEEGGNPQKNIAGISTTADVLTRTHPWAFETLFKEASKLGITDMLITSCWRPCYGSIAHRAGLGLDVCYIATPTQKVKINRIGLLFKGHSNNPYVSDAEKKLRNESLALQAQANNQSDQKATQAARNKRNERVEEMEKTQPGLMSALREGLRIQPVVGQLLDPWYIDLNTHSNAGRSINEQQSKIEQGHAHHLHITIREPKIYD
jgi:hypothetical protein